MKTLRESERNALRQALSDPRNVIVALGLDRGALRERRGYKIVCPWCNGGKNTPPCSLRTHDGILQVRCFSCNAGGDIFSLIAQVEGLDSRRDFVAVLTRASELARISPLLAYTPNVTSKPPRPTHCLDASAWDRGARGLLNLCPLEGSVAVGLATRGILAEAKADQWGELPVNARPADPPANNPPGLTNPPNSDPSSTVGTSTRTNDSTTTEPPDMTDPAEDSGLDRMLHGLETQALRAFVPWLWDRTGNIYKPQHRLCIPWRAPDGKIWNMQRRYAPLYGDESPPPKVAKYIEPPRHLASPLGPYPYGIDSLDLATAEEIWLVEGAADVLALRALNARKKQPRSLVALGLPGSASAWIRVREHVLPLLRGRVVSLAFDADSAGKNTVLATQGECYAAGALRVYNNTDRSRRNGCKDWCELTAFLWKKKKL